MSDASHDATTVTSEIRGRALIASLHLKVADEESLRLLDQLIDRSAASMQIAIVVIDVAEVELLPSLALGMLLRMSARCKEKQQTMKLANVRPRVRQVLALTKLDTVFELSDSIDSAIG